MWVTRFFDEFQTSIPAASTFVIASEETFVYSAFCLPLLGPEIDEDEVLAPVVARREAQIGEEGLRNFHADWSPRAEALRMIQLGRSGLFFGMT